MSKKQVKIYLSERCEEYLNQFPWGDTISGSVSLLVEWGLYTIQRAFSNAYHRFNDSQRILIINSVTSLGFSPKMYTPAVFASFLEDWVLNDNGQCFEKSKEDVETMINNIKSMPDTEVISIICWARNYWNYPGLDTREYIKKSFSRYIQD